MKLRLALSLPLAVAGALLAVVPGWILPVCTVEHGKTPMKCHWSGSMLTGFGWTFIAIAILLFFSRSWQVRLGIAATALLVVVTVALTPTYLIGMCAMPTMPCRTGTYPAALVLLAGIALINIGIIFFLRHYGKQESRSHEAPDNLHHRSAQP